MNFYRQNGACDSHNNKQSKNHMKNTPSENLKNLAATSPHTKVHETDITVKHLVQQGIYTWINKRSLITKWFSAIPVGAIEL